MIPQPIAADALTDVVIRDGSTVCFRRADDHDVDALLQFLQALSLRSLYYRFHGLPALRATDVRLLIGADGHPAMALVAESGGRIVAFAGYYIGPTVSDRAEVAFAVSDAVQGHGIGTRLLEQLAAVARERGIRTFDAYVLAENRRMLDVFRNSGFAETVSSLEHGVCHVALSLALTDEFVEHAAARSQIAASASMRAFFEPRVVAVIGANRPRGKIGSEILNNLNVAGFTGTIVPIHPTARRDRRSDGLSSRRGYPRPG